MFQNKEQSELVLTIVWQTWISDTGDGTWKRIKDDISFPTPPPERGPRSENEPRVPNF